MITYPEGYTEEVEIKKENKHLYPSLEQYFEGMEQEDSFSNDTLSDNYKHWLKRQELNDIICLYNALKEYKYQMDNSRSTDHHKMAKHNYEKTLEEIIALERTEGCLQMKSMLNHVY